MNLIMCCVVALNLENIHWKLINSCCVCLKVQVTGSVISGKLLALHICHNKVKTLRAEIARVMVISRRNIKTVLN